MWDGRPLDSSGYGDVTKWNLHLPPESGGRAAYMETRPWQHKDDEAQIVLHHGATRNLHGPPHPPPNFPRHRLQTMDSHNLAPVFIGGVESIAKFLSMREGRGEMTESPKHAHVNSQRRITNLKVKFEAAGGGGGGEEGEIPGLVWARKQRDVAGTWGQREQGLKA